MPSLWDLNLRFAYELPGLSQSRWQPRLLVDIFHLGSERETVDFVQLHYRKLDEDGNQTDPNPTYDQPVRFQPPTAVRVGLEVYF